MADRPRSKRPCGTWPRGPSRPPLDEAKERLAILRQTVRAPDPANVEEIAASDAVLRTVLDVMAPYGLEGPEAIDATRALRAALHGFVSLEAAGGFGMPRDVDRSFEELVALLDQGLRSWARVGRSAATATTPPTPTGR